MMQWLNLQVKIPYLPLEELKCVFVSGRARFPNISFFLTYPTVKPLFFVLNL